jgi:hypothetical protein
VYYKTKVLGEDFKPLQPKMLSRDTSDAKKVIVRFFVPCLPLVFDTKTLKEVKDYGFEVYNNDVRQTISSATIKNDSVILTCAAELTGKIEVIYAGLNAANVESGNGRGHGNLRDSDDETAFLHYIDPNLKENDEYVYPHYDNLTSYTPASGEPKDENDNVIYNKPYPLYNFSVAFYYAIPAGESKYEVPELADPIDGIKKTDAGNIKISVSGASLKVDAGTASLLQVNLFDASGKKIKSFGESFSAKNYNLSGLSSGIYIVKVQTNNAVKSAKIIL